MTGQVSWTLQCQNWNFSASRSLFSLFHQILEIFLVKNCQKPNAFAKFTSQNLMPGQKLTPAKPNSQTRTSVPTFIRGYPPEFKFGIF